MKIEVVYRKIGGGRGKRDEENGCEEVKERWKIDIN